MNEASDDVSQGLGPDPGLSRQREACPPPRLLIGYEHVRCSTNTDVILPAALPDLASAEALDAFEPTVIQLAERHKPPCPVCATAMDFAVWGPHDDEVEGRWPLTGSIDAPAKAYERVCVHCDHRHRYTSDANDIDNCPGCGADANPISVAAHER